MRIREFVWTQDNIDHIARHGVSPHEVEEVCMGRPWVRRVKSEGQNPVYYVRGQTAAGRYLSCLLIHLADGKGYAITARPMTEREKQQYRKWRRL